MKKILYDKEFYKNRNKKTYIAATEILDIVKRYYTPASVIDVGGGVGTFLKASQEVFDMSGNVCLVEGDYIPVDLLEIDQSYYHSYNLEKPLDGLGRFDLAICLEVAEHLSGSRADSLVKDLCNLSEVVLFSAAYVMQKGDGHINEQNLSYWIRLFGNNGYIAYDLIRPNIQYSENIPWWYKQNIILYVKKDSTVDRGIRDNIPYLPPLDMVSFDMVFERLQIYEDMMRNPICKVGWWIQRLVKGNR